MTSNNIFKSITIEQNSQWYTLEREDARFHLDANVDPIRLYVPEGRAKREVCYRGHLPKGLLQFLDIKEQVAEVVVNNVVNSRSHYAVEEILKEAGVLDLPDALRSNETPQDDEEGVDDESDASLDPDVLEESDEIHASVADNNEESDITAERDTQDASDDDNDRENETETRPATSSKPDGSEEYYSVHSARSTLFGHESRRSPIWQSQALEVEADESDDSVYSSAESVYSSDTESSLATRLSRLDTTQRTTSDPYTALLDRIIKAASRTAFPTQERFSFSTLPAHVPSSAPGFESIFGARSPQRNSKVGAAGELFVRGLWFQRHDIETNNSKGLRTPLMPPPSGFRHRQLEEQDQTPGFSS